MEPPRLTREQHRRYCVPPTTLQRYFLVIVIVPIMVPVAMLLAFLGFRRIYQALHISHAELLSQSVLTMDASILEGSPSPNSPEASKQRYVHPELHAAIAKASKYRGVNFDSDANQWAANGRTYSNELDAAKAAYLLHVAEQQRARRATEPDQAKSDEAEQGAVAFASVSSATASPRVGESLASASSPRRTTQAALIAGAPVDVTPAYARAEAPEVIARVSLRDARNLDPAQISARRKQELRLFYMFWEPERPDIDQHVDDLFARHEFRHIARALKTKFGVLPPGWEDELEGV